MSYRRKTILAGTYIRTHTHTHIQTFFFNDIFGIRGLKYAQKCEKLDFENFHRHNAFSLRKQYMRVCEMKNFQKKEKLSGSIKKSSSN